MPRMAWALFWLGACAPVDGSPPGDGSLDFVVDVGPTPIAEGALAPGGLLLDRVEVVLSGDATQARLDEALAAVDGTVASSRPGRPWLAVSVPLQVDLAAAQATADLLAGFPGIAFAAPAWTARADLPPRAAAPEGVGGSSNPYLGDQRFYAAWNAAPLATARVPVWVVDDFTTNAVLPEMSAQRFVGPEAPAIQLPKDDGTFAGNHGHWVASLLGADAGGRPPVGTHPDPQATLDLVSLNKLGLGGTTDLFHELDRRLPTDGFFVLSTSFGFASSVAVEQRHLHAMHWREVVLGRADAMIHLTSSGNEGLKTTAEMVVESAFSLQASTDDLHGTGDLAEALDDAWADAIARVGAGMRQRGGHTLIVGASDAEGAESSFSNRGSDVRMAGEQLIGVCGRADGTQCVDTKAFGKLMTANGTSGSTPLAAGLVAWARALAPTRGPAEIADLMLDHFDGRWVDALSLTLSLESPTLPVRRTLLDVVTDGVFDANDIEAFLLVLDEAAKAGASAPATWPRADLNGDGRVLEDGVAPFDLDGDGRLGAVEVQVAGDDAEVTETLVLDETRVSDLDVVCWGAFAGPFAPGTEARRDDLLRARCQPPPTLSGRVTVTQVETGGPDCVLVDSEDVIDLVLALPDTVVSVQGTHRLDYNDQPGGVKLQETGVHGLEPSDDDGNQAASRWKPDRNTIDVVYRYEQQGGPGTPVGIGVTKLTYTSPQEGVLDFNRHSVEDIEGCLVTYTATGVVR